MCYSAISIISWISSVGFFFPFFIIDNFCSRKLLKDKVWRSFNEFFFLLTNIYIRKSIPNPINQFKISLLQNYASVTFHSLSWKKKFGRLIRFYRTDTEFRQTQENWSEKIKSRISWWCWNASIVKFRHKVFDSLWWHYKQKRMSFIHSFMHSFTICEFLYKVLILYFPMTLWSSAPVFQIRANCYPDPWKLVNFPKVIVAQCLLNAVREAPKETQLRNCVLSFVYH